MRQSEQGPWGNPADLGLDFYARGATNAGADIKIMQEAIGDLLAACLWLARHRHYFLLLVTMYVLIAFYNNVIVPMHNYIFLPVFNTVWPRTPSHSMGHAQHKCKSSMAEKRASLARHPTTEIRNGHGARRRRFWTIDCMHAAWPAGTQQYKNRAQSLLVHGLPVSVAVEAVRLFPDDLGAAADWGYACVCSTIISKTEEMRAQIEDPFIIDDPNGVCQEM